MRVSISNVSGASQWRKESVTIIESQEPMEEDGEEHEGDVESDGVEREEKEERGAEGQFLSVPSQSITASSSAETLTDNTLTAPSTPTPSLAHTTIMEDSLTKSCSVQESCVGIPRILTSDNSQSQSSVESPPPPPIVEKKVGQTVSNTPHYPPCSRAPSRVPAVPGSPPRCHSTAW